MSRNGIKQVTEIRIQWKQIEEMKQKQIKFALQRERFLYFECP